MLLQPLTIARNTLIESLRQPVVLLIVLASGILQLFNTWNTGYTMGLEQTGEVKGDDKLLFDLGLATVFVCGTLLAGFIATAVMSREIENKTVLTIVSKPVSRVSLILGKFLGVAGSLLLSSIVMILFMLFAIRHGVMSTAADEIDGPVVTFVFGAVLLSLAIAAWCNFYYSWSFPQTAVLLMLPLVLIGYILTLSLSKHWEWQPLLKDLKPQVTLASATLLLALIVLAAVATAASTRLNQVATIVACMLVFVAAMMSNSIVGSRVFHNTIAGTVGDYVPVDLNTPELATLGSQGRLELDGPPESPIRVGDSLFVSPTPNGFPMIWASFERFNGSLTDANQMMGPGTPPAIVVTGVSAKTITIRHIGGKPLSIVRNPFPGDYVFTAPTEIRPHWLVVWGVVPNLQFYWLLDAVSQSRPIPPVYLVTVFVYTLVQVVFFLSLAVVLFQKRDVG